MLSIAMVGVAATVILSTQQDLTVASQDREALQAFYAAEYAVAQAKDFLASTATADGLTPASFVARGGWSPMLARLARAGATQGCDGEPTKATPRMAWSALPGGAVRWRFCIHDDAGDLARFDPGARDPLHLITIEAWGAAGPAQTHLAVDVGDLALRTATWSQR